MSAQHRHSSRQDQGYTLIETLIALALLATALLGFGALMSESLRTSHQAILDDLATLQAQNLAEQIRANPVAVTQGDYLSLTGEPEGPDCEAVDCPPTQMARYDFRNWNRQNRELLPEGTGSVAATTEEHYQITVTWRSGDSSTTHQLSFRPPSLP